MQTKKFYIPQTQETISENIHEYNFIKNGTRLILEVKYEDNKVIFVLMKSDSQLLWIGKIDLNSLPQGCVYKSICQTNMMLFKQIID